MPRATKTSTTTRSSVDSPHVLEMRPFDVKRVGNYGFLFLETDPSTSDELDFLMRSDLKEFLR